MKNQSYQSGVTSIFIVIFTALLLSVITLSFIGIMSRDMIRSSDDELSQSAYDSAMAGVEDAKRVILTAQGSGTAADKAHKAITDSQCSTVIDAGIAGSSGDEEVVLESTSAGDGRELNQAYTCVKIKLNSSNYELVLGTPMRSEIVPLRGVSKFTKVRIDWEVAKQEVLNASCGRGALINADAGLLCPQATWAGGSTAIAALLRAQFIMPDDGFRLDDLDNNGAGQTVFLYPGTGLSDLDLSKLERYVSDYGTSGSTNEPQAIDCEAAATGGPSGYHCWVTIDLDKEVPARSPLALLRLTAIYQATQARVTLLDDGGNVVEFDGVQPIVDSTGRANDLFRRVEARLALASDIGYPEAALSTEGAICKNFYITDNAATSGQIAPTCVP